MAETSPLVKAFVVGPIGDRDAPDGSESRRTYEDAMQVLEEVILPACSAFGIEAIRADQIARTGDIPEQVCRLLRDSQLVIADLSGANANVMYELGLRHTTGKLTVQLGERDRLPFDIAAIRTIMFKRTEGGFVEARRKLSQALATGLETGGDPVTATRVWFESAGISPVLPDASLEDELGEPGFLEMLADAEDGMQSLGRALDNSTTVTQEITRLLDESTARMANLESTGSGSPGAKLALANRLASLLDDPASRLEVNAGDLAQSVQRIEPGIKYLLGRLAAEPEALSNAPAFPGQIRTLTDAAEASVPTTLRFKESMEGIGDAARSLRRVGRRIAAALQSIADSSARVAAWKSLTQNLST